MVVITAFNLKGTIVVMTLWQKSILTTEFIDFLNHLTIYLYLVAVYLFMGNLWATNPWPWVRRLWVWRSPYCSMRRIAASTMPSKYSGCIPSSGSPCCFRLRSAWWNLFQWYKTLQNQVLQRLPLQNHIYSTFLPRKKFFCSPIKPCKIRFCSLLSPA